MINKGSNFADFVRFHPHTYARIKQSLLPLMAFKFLDLNINYHGNRKLNQINRCNKLSFFMQ